MKKYNVYDKLWDIYLALSTSEALYLIRNYPDRYRWTVA